MTAPLPELSNEQKLTYIYHTLQAQESRRKRAAFYRFLKWLVVIGCVYLIATYPKEIFSKISELVRPIVMEQVDMIMEQNKNNLLKSIKDVLPDEIELAPATKATPTKSESTTQKPKTPTTTSTTKK